MSRVSPLSQVEENYETVVIGGGIVGAGVFRDLALNGVKTLLEIGRAHV